MICPGCKCLLCRDYSVLVWRCGGCDRLFREQKDGLLELQAGKKFVEGQAKRIVDEHHIMLIAERDAFKRRCPACGGPANNCGSGFDFRCERCRLDFSLREGELVPAREQSKPRPTMREFYEMEK